jgi:hypothetical protein
LCCINSTNCCFTSCWLMIFENCIGAKITHLKIKKRSLFKNAFLF